MTCVPTTAQLETKRRTSCFRLVCAIILDGEVAGLAVQNWINILRLIASWPKGFYVLFIYL